jgi:hypothetical protein
MNDSKLKGFARQVKQFAAQFAQSGSSLLGEIIPVQEMEKWVREEVGRHRERVYGPLRTLLLFIEQVLSADHSCQDTVVRGLSEQVSLGQAPGSPSTGPYCKARQRLPLRLVQRLGRAVADRLSQQQMQQWKWRGREVKLVDGTTVSMPDTPDNHKNFPRSTGQKRGLAFPLARLVGVVSLSCGTVLDWAVGPYEGKQTGETALLWTLLDHFKRDDVLIADRLYASYFMIARLMQLGVDVVMRQHRSRHTDFRRGKRLGKCDHLVQWHRPARPDWMDEATYAAMPAMLTLREARVGGWTFASSLTDAKSVSKSELHDLYRQRWNIELDLRSIKVAMQMDVLRCKTAQMVRKEIAVHLLAYNLVRTVMARAACLACVQPRQLSFKGALQTINAFAHNLRHGLSDSLLQHHAALLDAVARMVLPQRPDRVEPRAVKRRPKPHRLLTQPRHVMRARLEKRKSRIMAEFA